MNMIAPMGSIGGGTADSLLAKLDAAQAAISRRQPAVAVQLLETFINEVEAQSGKRFNRDNAAHLATQAKTVIDSIVPHRRGQS